MPKVDSHDVQATFVRSTALLPGRLTSGSVLLRSTIWNLVGQLIPLLIAIPVLPIFLAKIGIDRFGILSLIWVAVGYFSLFDLGLARALTQIVAKKIGEQRDADAQNVTATALTLMTLISVGGAATLWAAAPWLTSRALNVPPPLYDETVMSLRLVAIALPFVTTSSGFVGVLMAYQRFGAINVIRTPAMILTVVLPLAVAFFTPTLEWLTAPLLAARILAWIAYSIVCAHLLLRRGAPLRPAREEIAPLLRLGSWMTVSNTVGPILVYVDRFIIAAYVSAAAVAYYSTPYEVVTKLLVIPGAIVMVLFSAFTMSFVSNRDRTSFLFRQAVKYIFLAVFPATFLIVLFADEILRVWLGSEFAENSRAVFQILAVGVLINSVAFAPNVLVQGIGRPDRVATLHVIELLVYLPSLWYATTHFGIEGAAVAWTARVAVDATVLYWSAALLLSFKKGALIRMAAACSGVSLLLIGSALMTTVLVKAAYLFAVAGLFCFVVWNGLLEPNERAAVRVALQRTLERSVRKQRRG